ncbi:MAG: transaminase [Steroidobacteraceae bacterium]
MPVNGYNSGRIAATGPHLFKTEMLAELLDRELEHFERTHQRSIHQLQSASRHFRGGVPMHWMADWGTPAPLVAREAVGAVLEDIDGHSYDDFCLGDTAAMFGHAPPAVVRAVGEQLARGFSTMLPSPDLVAAGDLLSERFGYEFWQLTQTASDANRCVIRWARAITGRPRVLVFDGCYHGMVDDSLVERLGEGTLAKPSLVGQFYSLGSGSVAIDFNDENSLRRELARRDVALVLCEPVMTNTGMIEPLPGFLRLLRDLTSQTGTLLAFDETHTQSSGRGGHARALGLEADFIVVGKAIAGGFPCAVYGCRAEIGAAMDAIDRTRPAGHSGMGTTLAGNALALAALCANLRDVATDEAYRAMLQGASRLQAGLEALIASAGLSWPVCRVGARVEIMFGTRRPQNAREARADENAQLHRALRVFLLNRGTLITPFHGMMLVSPVTSGAQMDRLLKGFGNFLEACR